MGTEVGAWLEFGINSNATFSRGKEVPLRLSYLASYEKMGKARESGFHVLRFIGRVLTRARARLKTGMQEPGLYSYQSALQGGM